MIPQGLTHEHFRLAAAAIDREGVPSERNSVHYDLLLDDQRYPPKYLISLAARFATGREHPPSEFNAVEARDYFRRKGYEVIDRRQESLRLIADEDDESRFPEGKRRYRLHRSLERDGSITRKAKAQRLADTGWLACDLCDFDFANIYGKRGEGFIEAHHSIPVAELEGNIKTRISDIALVCSNCHHMLHRGDLLTIQELRKLVRGMREMSNQYTAIVQQHGEWWIGWIEEVPGVNSQGRTRDELLENLSDALDEALEMNRADARAAAQGAYEEVGISP